MSTVIYPLITPIVAYYAFKYTSNVVIDIAINKTKNTLWSMVSYPFTKQIKEQQNIIKCICEKCKKENCKKCSDGIEDIDSYEVLETKEKMD